MSTDLSVIDLIVQASLVVQLVMLGLVAASVASWAVIFRKWRVLGDARRQAERFEDTFWSGTDLVSVYNGIDERGEDICGLERIFQAGFREFARLRQHANLSTSEAVEGAQRAMRVAVSREMDFLEQNLSFLATVGSTSPYVGLFGTVWGIMNSFRALGAMNQATLASVAPGIAEALIATAIGLFAAIPAVIAYNRYANDADRLASRFDIFVEEFSTILQRQAHD